jgi:hypothetical protein
MAQSADALLALAKSTVAHKQGSGKLTRTSPLYQSVVLDSLARYVVSQAFTLTVTPG